MVLKVASYTFSSPQHTSLDTEWCKRPSNIAEVVVLALFFFTLHIIIRLGDACMNRIDGLVNNSILVHGAICVNDVGSQLVWTKSASIDIPLDKVDRATFVGRIGQSSHIKTPQSKDDDNTRCNFESILWVKCLTKRKSNTVMYRNGFTIRYLSRKCINA